MKNFLKILTTIMLLTVVFCLAGCSPKAKVQYISSSKEGDAVYVAEMICEKNLSSTVSIYSSYSENEKNVYGTGIILTQNGYVLTTVYSIFGSYTEREISALPTLSGNIVVSNNGSFVKVNLAVVNIDFKSGLAILKITDNDKVFVPVTLETENLPVIGEYTASLVNAKAMGISAVEGYISKLYVTRNLSDTEIKVNNLMQVDIRANEGSFGGGLFNNKGRLTGIILDRQNTANTSSLDPIYNITYAYDIERIIDYINTGNYGFKIGA